MDFQFYRRLTVRYEVVNLNDLLNFQFYRRLTNIEDVY